MTYYLKFGRYFFLILTQFIISIVWIIKDYIKDYHIWPWFWPTIALIFGFYLVKFLYKKLFNKPALVINELYILDNVNNVKYYWDDINEVIETDDFLYIYLYDPKKYLSKINNPVRRIGPVISLYFFKKRTPYQIGLHTIKINDRKEFLELLNNYSIASQDAANSIIKLKRPFTNIR